MQITWRVFLKFIVRKRKRKKAGEEGNERVALLTDCCQGSVTVCRDNTYGVVTPTGKDPEGDCGWGVESRRPPLPKMPKTDSTAHDFRIGELAGRRVPCIEED